MKGLVWSRMMLKDDCVLGTLKLVVVVVVVVFMIVQLSEYFARCQLRGTDSLLPKPTLKIIAFNDNLAQGCREAEC